MGRAQAAAAVRLAAANIVVLLQVYRAFRTVKRGGRLVEDDVDGILAKRGGRIFVTFCGH